MKELKKAKKILVFAREAGGASYISSLLKKFKVSKTKISCLAEGAARNVFEAQGFKVRNELDTRVDLILLGATPGKSLEKQLIEFGAENKIPVFSFVDHYWNMWQRFADPKTLKKWKFVPNRVYVIDSFAKKKIVIQGLKSSIVSVLPHPNFILKRKKGRVSSDNVKRTLGIPREKGVLLFVSENLFRQSKKWQWEQAFEKDYRVFARKLVRQVITLNLPYVVVIKSHPSEERNWSLILKGFRGSSYRIVKDFDRTSLINAATAVFGINSMMLLEAVAQKKKVYSWHAVKSNPLSRLSYLRPDITEIKDIKDVI